MKKTAVIQLFEHGILGITTHCLSPQDSYKIVKFRKNIRSIIEDIQAGERDIMAEVGIEDAAEFDRRRAELQGRIGSLENDELRELATLDTMFQRFSLMREQLRSEDVQIFAPRLDYATWKKLQDENRNDTADILSGWVEDITEGILWTPPEL